MTYPTCSDYRVRIPEPGTADTDGGMVPGICLFLPVHGVLIDLLWNQDKYSYKRHKWIIENMQENADTNVIPVRKYS